MMSWLYRNAARPLLFAQDSEQVHGTTLGALGAVARSGMLSSVMRTVCGSPALPVEVCGLKFPNPIGLAAGMDKFAEAVPVWEAMGFGFSELGGVTHLEQPGNPKPRMFRAVEDQALVNRMGFNNPGAEKMGLALEAWRKSGLWPAHPVGMNLGKSKITPLEEAAEDYLWSFKRLRDLVDFFVVNVSSPNTPNLRQLQDKGALEQIAAAIHRENKPEHPGGVKPVLVKVAPDLTFEALDDVVEVVLAKGFSGIVATNTTIARPEGRTPRLQRVYGETGGLSGKPLKARSTEVIRHLWKRTQGKVPLIGVGGIFTADDAWEKIVAGASLLEVYSALVYEGPRLPRSLVEGLSERLQRDGFKSVADAVGSAA